MLLKKKKKRWRRWKIPFISLFWLLSLSVLEESVPSCYIYVFFFLFLFSQSLSLTFLSHNIHSLFANAKEKLLVTLQRKLLIICNVIKVCGCDDNLLFFFPFFLFFFASLCLSWRNWEKDQRECLSREIENERLVNYSFIYLHAFQRMINSLMTLQQNNHNNTFTMSKAWVSEWVSENESSVMKRRNVKQSMLFVSKGDEYMS
jgi:hypothetical protein